MIRNRYSELRAYIENRLPQLGLLQEQIDGDIDEISLAEGGHNETESGYHLCTFRYTGRIYIERLSAVQLPLLLLYVRSWLDEYDDTRGKYNLSDPAVDVIPLDPEKMIDVMVKTEFADEVFLSPVEHAGNETLEWDGRHFDVSPYVVDYAERGVVNDAPTEA